MPPVQEYGSTTLWFPDQAVRGSLVKAYEMGLCSWTPFQPEPPLIFASLYIDFLIKLKRNILADSMTIVFSFSVTGLSYRWITNEAEEKAKTLELTLLDTDFRPLFPQP